MKGNQASSLKYRLRVSRITVADEQLLRLVGQYLQTDLGKRYE